MSERLTDEQMREIRLAINASEPLLAEDPDTSLAAKWWLPRVKAFCGEVIRLRGVVGRLVEALDWVADNLGAGIEWGGPFDKDHLQGVYHCTHCDARWKPEGDLTEHHNSGCGLAGMMAALKLAGEE
ncbi:MAG: hypothetical protein U1E51_06670 [Candidatus Binatia bacterium]|nr:hypothetical protein [Candidatus Binatia bacterium]